LTLSGCSSEKPKEKPAAKEKGDGAVAEAKPSGSTSAGKEELASTGWGTVKGKVTYDGDPPPAEDFKPRMEAQTDKDHCLKGPTKDPTWTVGSDKGVANVVVWVRAPKGKYFKIPDDQKQRTDTVTIDQPFCAFTPHVVVVFPSYYDGATKKQKKTGQVFKVVNSAPITHNTNWEPGDALINSGRNVILTAKTGEQVIPVAPSKDRDAGGEQTIKFKCDIHKWMTGFARVYDHPFVAVTKDDGTYEIKNAPAGAELELVYWHEALGAPKVLKKITVKEGDNPAENFTISK
jgi:hypothetical protein